MVQEVVLALLAPEPSHGYELQARLQLALGPLSEGLNAGQVYVTLGRLEKAGLVGSQRVDRVGGRMSDQTKRVGLLKAVGGTPRFVAVVLLAEGLTLSLVAGAASLGLAWLVTPLLESPGAGFLGSAGAPRLAPSTIEAVAVTALALATISTLVPALRAARSSTVRALADTPRTPKRSQALIALSARLPVPLLLGLRISARRPRRILLSSLSILVTVTTVVTVLLVRGPNAQRFGGTLGSPQLDRLNAVLTAISVILAALAAINIVFVTWTTALEARRSSAITRAFGATPIEIAAGLSIAQLVPALIGTILGIPAGIGLYAAVRHGNNIATPSTALLVAVLIGTPLIVAALTVIPARLGARRSITAILQSELAL